MTRRPARQDSKKLDGNTTALQGAALAFAAQGKKNNINGKSENLNGHKTDIPASIPPAISKADGARKAANIASHQPIDNAQDSVESLSSSVSGTVRNRIELFSGSDIPDPKVSQAGAARDTQNRDGKPNVRTDPQHIAAQLAVDRSKTPVSSTQIASSKPVRTVGRLESNTTGPNKQDINLSSSTSIYVRTGQKNDTPADQRPTPPKSRARITSDLPPEKKEASMVTESRLLQRKAAARVANHGGTPGPDPDSLQPLSRPPIPPKPPLSPSTTQNAVMAAKSRPHPPPPPPPPPPSRPATVTRPSSLGGSGMTTPETPRSQQLVAQHSCSSLRPQHSGMSESSRLDAIAASSIATSRSPSPAKRNTPPPPPPHRRSRSRSRLHLHPTHNILDRSTNNGARNVSPAKSTASTATSGTLTPAASSTTMRRTMRPQKTGDEPDSHQGHHHRLKIRSHPHKHREGDRKRWRDQISERERKRYEGVWAANKGLWITPDEQVNLLNKSLKLEDMVISMVVRDIWSRSRLPRTLLEQIWNLVSGDGRALLSKEEFVVGMWLIDQSLKGRKLPAKVSQSVWDSVTVGGNWRITTSATANTALVDDDAGDARAKRFC